MRATLFLPIVSAALLAGGALAMPSAAHADATPVFTPSANVSVFASGFDGPRQIAFGTNGTLYVAEAGPGGTNSTAGQCTQVQEAGPYLGSPTGGAIASVSPTGKVTTLTTSLPSATGAEHSNVGAAAVAVVNGTVYVLEEAGGCSHGNPANPNGIYRLNSDGTVTLVADLSAWVHANPVAQPDVDYEPDGNWYSMVAVNGMLYALDANRGELVKIDPTSGQISRVIDISASQGHSVPTAVAYSNGSFYVANLGEFPIKPGSQTLLKIGLDGAISVVTKGLTAVTGLAADAHGNLFAVELSTVPAGGPVPGTGAVVEIDAGTSAIHIVAAGLVFPTGIAFGPDGALYVSQYSFGFPNGQVVRIALGTTAMPVVARAEGGSSASFTVTFSSTAPGQGQVYFGPTCSSLVEVATGDQTPGGTLHTVVVTGNDLPGTVGNIGIQAGQTYAYAVATITANGTVVDDNAGKCYSVTVPSS